MDGDGLRGVLAGGGTAIGTFVFEFGAGGDIGRIAARAGAQFVVYDLEHSALDWPALRLLATTTEAAGAVPIARVPSARRADISRALDQGARGVMIPMVDTAAGAEEAVSYARYAPQGTRGVILGSAHDNYRTADPVEVLAEQNDRTLVIAQIETAAALENVEDIAAVAGIDALWLGQFDLTTSLGIPGRFDHPRYSVAVRRVTSAAARHGKAAGIMPLAVEDTIEAARQGFRLLAYSGDHWIYRDALSSGIQQIRSRIRPV